MIILALLLASCKTKQSSSQSHTRMKAASQLSVQSQTASSDTTTSYTVTHTDGYTFTQETQIITEYDTSKPGNPVAKKTETEKNTFQGVQTDNAQSQEQGKRSESQTFSNETHNSELTTQDSESSSSVPIVGKSIKWYVIGGIIIAVVTLFTTWLARRNHKKTTSN